MPPLPPEVINAFLQQGVLGLLVLLLAAANVAQWLQNNSLQDKHRADLKESTDRLVKALATLDQAIELLSKVGRSK